MPRRKNSPQSPTIEKETTFTSQYRIVYANAFQLAIGDNDIAVSFGIAGASIGDPSIEHKKEVTVMLTHRSAKLLNQTLTGVLSRYEDAHGLINIPTIKLEEIRAKLQKTDESGN
jgi:hypothetical protein